MGRLVRIIQAGPKCRHMYSSDGEPEGDLMNTYRRGGSDVTTRADIGVKPPQAKCWQPPQVGNGKEWVFL